MGWFKEGETDSLLEGPEGRMPMYLKAGNDACRSPRNQWTEASRFLSLNLRAYVCLSGTPVVLSAVNLP